MWCSITRHGCWLCWLVTDRRHFWHLNKNILWRLNLLFKTIRKKSPLSLNFHMGSLNLWPEIKSNWIHSLFFLFMCNVSGAARISYPGFLPTVVLSFRPPEVLFFRPPITGSGEMEFLLCPEDEEAREPPLSWLPALDGEADTVLLDGAGDAELLRDAQDGLLLRVLLSGTSPWSFSALTSFLEWTLQPESTA